MVRRHIISQFKTYQQTTEYSCACASALMVLKHFGADNYDEMQIGKLVGVDTTHGTSVEGLSDHRLENRKSRFNYTVF